jgi:hypothetical protein
MPALPHVDTRLIRLESISRAEFDYINEIMNPRQRFVASA